VGTAALGCPVEPSSTIGRSIGDEVREIELRSFRSAGQPGAAAVPTFSGAGIIPVIDENPIPRPH